MNLKKLSVAALAVLTLFSCTKEVIKEVIVDNSEGNGKTHIQLAINPDALQTKANEHGDATPTAEELKIYNYAVFIFNSQGILEAALSASPYSDSNNNIPDDYNPDHSEPLTFDVDYGYNNQYMDNNGIVTLSEGTKYFFTIVNAPAELLAEQEEFLLSNTLTQDKILGETLTGEDDGSITLFEKIVGSYTCENNTASIDNTFSGNRGFMMTTTSGLYSRYCGSTELGVEVDETNPIEIKLTVGRAMIKASLASQLVPGDTENQVTGELVVSDYKLMNNPKEMNVVPNYTANNVLITPYYYAPTVTVANYFESSDYINVSEENSKTFTYGIENTNRLPKRGNTSAMVVKGKFTPYVVKDATNSSTITLDGEGNFWRIKDKTTNEYLPDYYGEAPDDAYVTQLGSQYEAIAYAKGICYYLVFLKNVNNTNDEYAVARNSYYRIDITSVQAAGEPDDNYETLIPEPEQPIEAQTYITVNITVDNWEIVDQPQGL